MNFFGLILIQQEKAAVESDKFMIQLAQCRSEVSQSDDLNVNNSSANKITALWEEVKKESILQYKLRVRDRSRKSTLTPASLNTIQEENENEMRASQTSTSVYKSTYGDKKEKNEVSQSLSLFEEEKAIITEATNFQDSVRSEAHDKLALENKELRQRLAQLQRLEDNRDVAQRKE